MRGEPFITHASHRSPQLTVQRPIGMLILLLLARYLAVTALARILEVPKPSAINEPFRREQNYIAQESFIIKGDDK
jgi:hypothetical protein